MSWSAIQTPESLKSSPWFQTLTVQQKQVAAYSLCTDTATAPVLFRDVSQSCNRVRASTFGSDGQHLSFTVTPGQVALVFQEAEKPRLLLGEEAMVLQGFPIAKVSDLVERTSNRVMADLAGNMVAVPVLFALMMAAVEGVHWREEQNTPENEPSDLEAAVVAFNAVVRNDSTPGEAPAQKRVKL